MSADEEAELKAWLGEVLGVEVSAARLTRLKQDASLRSYFRVATPDASWVLMRMPPEALKASEEGGAQPALEELPFLNLHRYLKGLGLRVPEVLHWDEARGAMVLEDLGDTTLEAHIAQHPARKASAYAEVVALLARMRAQAEKAPSPQCLAFQRAFDFELYMWELAHFREWGLDIWCGASRTPQEEASLGRCFEGLAQTLAALPRGFVHRDFQSRNLMLKEGAWCLIDFQDALQGPRAYDLVALLRDSYIELEPAFVDSMLSHYVACFEQHTGERIDEAAFAREFALLTVQRKLKDAARFEYIARHKGNADFLPFIPLSLRYVREALGRLPELQPLKQCLARWLVELA